MVWSVDDTVLSRENKDIHFEIHLQNHTEVGYRLWPQKVIYPRLYSIEDTNK